MSAEMVGAGGTTAGRPAQEATRELDFQVASRPLHQLSPILVLMSGKRPADALPGQPAKLQKKYVAQSV